jgi:hypothetical protein
VVEFWDEHVWQWLSGADPMADPLPEWYASYAGSGPGIVTRDGFVEPYLGDFLGHESEPRLVIMGLNPGYFDPPHQARDGMFADEIRDEYGSYSAWARSCPYDRDPWTAAHGPNNYFRSRLNFTRTWLDDAAATMNDMLVVELYPWHSARVTSAMHPPADVLTAFVWEPLAELAVRHYFAFGRPWVAAATELGLDLTAALGPAATTTTPRFPRGPCASIRRRQGTPSWSNGTPEALDRPERAKSKSSDMRSGRCRPRGRAHCLRSGRFRPVDQRPRAKQPIRGR